MSIVIGLPFSDRKIKSRFVHTKLGIGSHNKKPLVTSELREKEMNTKQICSGGGAHGGCFQDLQICEIKFAQGICRGSPGTFFTIFHNKLLDSCGRPQCVLSPFAETCSYCSNPYHIISAVTTLQAAAQLEVSVHFFFAWLTSSCCWLCLLYF